MSRRGHLVLEHPIDQITIGRHYRADLGDLTELRESIERLGLLTPITISVDHTLISGRRRLAAMRQLGRTSVPVWVAAGVSDELRTMLAIQDENTVRKSLTPTEQAALYAELKELLAEENARRQKATRFGARPTGVDGDDPNSDGGGESQPPLPPHRRKSRVKAAEAITGRDSSQQLEEVLELQRLAAEETEDADVREAAASALLGVDQNRKVHGQYLRVKTLQACRRLEAIAADESEPAAVRETAATQARALSQIDHPAQQARAAVRALAAVHRRRSEVADGEEATETPTAGTWQRRQCERIASLIRRDPGWWHDLDPQQIGSLATDAEWSLIEDHLTSAGVFLSAARTARHQQVAGVPARADAAA